MFYKKRLHYFSRLSTAITNCFLRGNNNAVVKATNPMLLREFYRLSTAITLTRIYADTCTLLHDSGMELLDAAEKVFSSTPDHHLLILTSVLYELKNVARKDPTKTTRCKMIVDKLRHRFTLLIEAHRIRIGLKPGLRWNRFIHKVNFTSESAVVDIRIIVAHSECSFHISC